MEHVSIRRAVENERIATQMHRITYLACSGDCSQGRQPCKTPQACHVPEEQGHHITRDERHSRVAAGVAFVAVVAFGLWLALK
jgi:hypothetical protein